ncbi:hypothetical protein, partial [Pseudoalteromonas sp. S327]|uniref:hypothetical protein n=1 Tax=Pseudoalteromonas sp. S327 TaxID=579535 RepID=UPI001BB0EB0D
RIRGFFVRFLAKKVKFAWALICHVIFFNSIFYSGLTPVSIRCVNTVTPVVRVGVRGSVVA